MFLLRRSRPWVWAGWVDNFARSPETPIRQPWARWGSGPLASINSIEEMELPPVSGTTLGGVSYEYQPFTPNYGMEYEVWWPVIGLGESALSLFIMQNWARVGIDWTNTLGVRLFHQPAGSGDTIRIQQWDDLDSFSDDVAVAGSPVAFNGNTITIKVWVDEDQFVRVWCNNTLVAAGNLEDDFKTSWQRRGMNFMNQSAVSAWFRWIAIYDRGSSFPAFNRWSSIFYDDFGRADGAVGNGWTQIGSNAALRSGTWATINTTDGSRGLLRDTGITSGKVRIEGTVGGFINPNATADSGLVLCSNSAGTQGLCANIFSNKLYIARYSSALSNNPPSFTDYSDKTTGVTVANGDKVAFCVYDGNAHVEINGVKRLFATNIHSVVPATNSYAGLRVERDSSNNSLSWNDVHIYSGT